ncbi:MAG: hypothetical protein O9301_01185 [Leptospira sp.]|nr:hypothetical protein [Leptospira sp.]
MIRFLIFFLCSVFAVWGYTPGKWSHKDIYIFQKNKKGPSKEIVRNNEGTVIYVAEYQYNEEGKLEIETYSDKEGKGDGKTIYRYTESRISSEDVYDEQGTLITQKGFLYKGSTLKKVTIKSLEDKATVTYNLETNNEGNVIAGDSRSNESKDVDSFRFSLDPKRPNVQIQKFLDEKNKTLGEILFKYDAKGQLVEREFLQGENKRVHKLKYRPDGLLDSHSFHVKQGESWILEKTHVLVYEDQNKSKLSKKD